MRYIKKVKTALGIIIIIFLVVSAVTIPFSLSTFESKYQGKSELKVSAGEINIITPENKTIGVSTGYYPATYGFENDEFYEYPEGWINLTRNHAIYSIEVRPNLAGHKIALEFFDNSVANDVRIEQVFTSGPQEYGTIEFLYYQELMQDGIIELRSGEGGDSQAIAILIDEDNSDTFEYYINGSFYEFGAGMFQRDTWFHIRVDFECGTGNYQGLSPDHFNVYLNEIKVVDNAPFWRKTNNMHNILFSTGVWSYYYIDAVGYSWDPNYNIGDNLHEGLYLSFDNSTALNWTGYSLDGQANKTISGNDTIVMPVDGKHKIQVFGNNSLGTMFNSNIVHFTVDATPPTSDISFVPYSGSNKVIKSTDFTLVANDGSGSGVDVIHYRINNSGWITYDTPFNLGNYDYDDYLISYYSTDLIGNNESVKTLLVELVEQTPDIPGYEVCIIFCIIGLASIILLKKTSSNIKY